MSFQYQESSSQEGKPLYLFRFVKQAKEWTYNNTDESITFLGVVYSPFPIEISKFGYSGDARAEGVDITMPHTAELCAYLDSGAASSGVSIFVRKIHMVEAPATGLFTPPVLAQDAPVIWVGELVGLSRPSVNSRVLRCNTLSLSMQRNGLRLAWGRGCPHMLYDGMCRVDKGSFGVGLGGASVSNGITLSSGTLGGYGSDYFSGGFIEWVVEGVLVERRGIDTHTGNDITLIGGTIGMSGASGFVAYPGCPRTIDVCNGRFGNSMNFGGIRYLQGKNPFSGSPIF